MRVLVSVASKHGSTGQIGDTIAERLIRAGFEVDVIPPGEVRDGARYEAAVIGSAVYAGHWLAEAKRLIESYAAHWANARVWLFSSGPVGDPPKPEEDPVDVSELVTMVRPVEHRVFPGRIDLSALGFAEKAVVKALRAPTGDFRDFDAIDEWAGTIANHLNREHAAADATPDR